LANADWVRFGLDPAADSNVTRVRARTRPERYSTTVPLMIAAAAGAARTIQTQAFTS
jgi:hypothetical protein